MCVRRPSGEMLSPLLVLVFLRPIYANVLFLPRGQLYASFDHWTLHFPIQTQTSWTYVEKLTHQVELFKSKFTSRFAEHRHHQRIDLIQRIWGKFMHETDLLDVELNVTIAALQHLKAPSSNRVKRAILPFVGDALSSLFGTATTNEIQDILSRVNDLTDAQDEVLNVIDNSVTMINQTIVDVDMNRRTITRLMNSTNYLTDRLNGLKDVVLNSYFASILESDMNNVFTDLSTSIRDFRKSIMNLETILSLAENGILPRSLLPPSRFVRILEDIQKGLPRELALPFSPSDTDHYFSICHTQTIRTTESVSVLVTIPLISIQQHFNVFQIFNVPVPKASGSQTIVANYDVEPAKFIALSQDSLQFMFVDDDDIQLYLRRRLPFCPIRRPIMNVLSSTMCITALLTNQTDKIDRFCDNVIRVNQSSDPTAEYIGNGHWIVISVNPLDLEIRCKTGAIVNSTKVVTTVAPLTLISLDFGCAASNFHFQLPTHYRTDSQIEPYQIQHMNRSLMTNDVWYRVNTSIPDDVHFDRALASLPPMQMKAVTLSAVKQHLQVLKLRNRHYYRTVVIPSVSVSTIAVLVALVLVSLRYVRCLSFILLYIRSRVTPDSHPAPDSTVDDATTPDSAEGPARHDNPGQDAPPSWLSPSDRTRRP